MKRGRSYRALNIQFVWKGGYDMLLQMDSTDIKFKLDLISPIRIDLSTWNKYFVPEPLFFEFWTFIICNLLTLEFASFQFLHQFTLLLTPCLYSSREKGFKEKTSEFQTRWRAFVFNGPIFTHLCTVQTLLGFPDRSHNTMPLAAAVAQSVYYP